MAVESIDPRPEDLIDTPEAAKIAGVSVAALYRWIVSGRVKAWKKKGGKQPRYFVSRAEIEGLWEQVPAPKFKPPFDPADLPASKRELEARLAAAREKIWGKKKV